MKVSDDDPVSAAALVSVAVMVCAPWARPVGVKAQTPEALAVVLPRTVEPSLSVTVALASAVPVSVSLEVMLLAPVECASAAVTVGAKVS